MRFLRIVSLAVVSLLVATVCFGCGASGDKPGAGTTIADKVYNAVSPHVGETVYTRDPDDSTKYLMDRFNDAADSNQEWKFSQPEFTQGPGGVENGMTIRFNDGSSLILHESPNPGTYSGLRLDLVEISR